MGAGHGFVLRMSGGTRLEPSLQSVAFLTPLLLPRYAPLARRTLRRRARPPTCCSTTKPSSCLARRSWSWVPLAPPSTVSAGLGGMLLLLSAGRWLAACACGPSLLHAGEWVRRWHVAGDCSPVAGSLCAAFQGHEYLQLACISLLNIAQSALVFVGLALGAWAGACKGAGWWGCAVLRVCHGMLICNHAGSPLP